MHRLATILCAAGVLTLLGGGGPAFAQRTCSALESQLLQLQAGGLSRGEAARAEMLRQRLARSGCGGGVPMVRTTRAAPEPRRERGISRQTQPRSHALRRPDVPLSEPAPSPAATYRTMCVRHCDGYYFPVSFSTTRDHFSEDAETCARMCPEADAGLYFHADGEGPEQMMSLAGAAYAELPAAFRYRQQFDAGCSCGRPAVAEAAAGGAASGDRGRFRPALPRPRSAPAEDPETAANRQGGFALAEIEPEAFATIHGRFGRTIRQIAPGYGSGVASGLLARPVSQ